MSRTNQVIFFAIIVILLTLVLLVDNLAREAIQLEGQEVSFSAINGAIVHVYFEGTFVKFQSQSEEQYIIEYLDAPEDCCWIGKKGEIEASLPSGSEYRRSDVLKQGNYAFRVISQSKVDFYLLEEFQPNEIGYIGEELNIYVDIYFP